MSIRPTKWTDSRIEIVRSMLVQGKTYAEIAAHPRLQATAGAVAMLASRKGFTNSSKVMRDAAKARGTTVSTLKARLIEILASDAALLSNVLDDGVM